MDLDSLELADPLLGATDAARMKEFAELQAIISRAPGQAEGHELHRQPVPVAIHHHSRKIVGFAEHDAVAGIGLVQSQHVVAESDRGRTGRGRTPDRVMFPRPTNRAELGSSTGC